MESLLCWARRFNVASRRMAEGRGTHIGRFPYSRPQFRCRSRPVPSCDSDLMEAAELLLLGREDLAAARWQAARERFESALAAEETADALDGLGQALWWLGEISRAVELRERAYVELRKGDDVRRAARLALWLSTEYSGLFGNDAASNGWLARAERLVEALPRCAEQGWVIFRRGKRRTDPGASEKDARAVIAIASETGDRDLEVA